MDTSDPAGPDPADGATEPDAGDAQGVPVPHEQAVEGSSETFEAVEGVYVIHPPENESGAEQGPDVERGSDG
jgi:hypothetical protein